MLREDKRILNGICFKRKGGGREEQNDLIWEEIVMANQISRQGASLDQQEKEGTEKINPRFISKTSLIKTEVHTIKDMVWNIYHVT